MPIKRLVIDTNVLLAAALAIHHDRPDSPALRLFLLAIEKEDVILVESTQMLYELADTLALPKLGLPPAFVTEFVKMITDVADIVTIRGLDMGCRDDRDDMFIETAVNGCADALVTRDLDLQTKRVRYDLQKRDCIVKSVTEILETLGATSSR